MRVETSLTVRRLGRVSYAEAERIQAALVRRRRAGDIGDQLLLLEHPHVITLGTASDEEHVLLDEADRRLLGIELFESGRGGDVTYHGPGQIVGYPILALAEERRDLHRYVRDLERVLIDALATFGIDGKREEGLTGVWTDAGKVAAIGVRVSSGWITSHGFALNVATDLSYFASIVPCGIHGRTVISMRSILGEEISIVRAQDAVVAAFAAEYGYASVVEEGPPPPEWLSTPLSPASSSSGQVPSGPANSSKSR